MTPKTKIAEVNVNKWDHIKLEISSAQQRKPSTE